MYRTRYRIVCRRAGEPVSIIISRIALRSTRGRVEIGDLDFARIRRRTGMPRIRFALSRLRSTPELELC